MQIKITLDYALKNGQQINRFVIEADSRHTLEDINTLINKHAVKDSSITCTDPDLVWRAFVEHVGTNSVVYEIPQKYTDAFNLYTKTLALFA